MVKCGGRKIDVEQIRRITGKGYMVLVPWWGLGEIIFMSIFKLEW